MKVNKLFSRVYGTVATMLLFVVATCSFSACSKDDDASVDVPYAKSRTVMVYMVAENSLYSNVARDMEEMLSGMDNDTLYAGDRLVIYLDDRGLPRIYVVDKTIKKTNFSELTPVVKYEEDANSASAAQLGAFVDFVKNQYPADSYGLVLWSHASGWLPSDFSGDDSGEALSRRRAFGLDNGMNTGNNVGNQMNIANMADALQKALKGDKFDFIFFDACMMQNIEVAYELRHVTKHLIASPAEIPASGANYLTMTRAMFRQDDYANKMLEVYYHEYLKSVGVVISAVNTSDLDDYAAYMKSIVATYRSKMLTMDISSMLNYWHYGVRSWSTTYPDFLDMQGIMQYLYNDDKEGYAQWKAKTDKVVTCLQTGMWYHYDAWNNRGELYPIDETQCCGVTMFIPFDKYSSDHSYNDDYLKTSWAKAVWLE